MPLQRVHLARDFFENVIHAREVLLSILKARLRQSFLSFEFCYSRRFFDNRATVGWSAAQDLPNASLFDQRIGLRPKPRAHEQLLNIAQAAEFPIQQILTIARAEQTPRDDDFPGTKLLLIELAAADF